MIVLAVDTATDRLSVAAGEPLGPVAVRFQSGARKHTGHLAILIEEVLGELGRSIGQVDALAVADGPGSFTGLRVAAAWAKGLARVRNLPVWAASTLLIRATPYLGEGAIVAAIGSAQRGELFYAEYRGDPAGAIATVVRPTVIPIGADPPGTIPSVVVGNLEAEAMTGWRWAGSPRMVTGQTGLPNAGDLIALIGRVGGAQQLAEWSEWEPEYGRLAEAQVKWERIHGASLADSPRFPR